MTRRAAWHPSKGGSGKMTGHPAGASAIAQIPHICTSFSYNPGSRRSSSTRRKTRSEAEVEGGADGPR